MLVVARISAITDYRSDDISSSSLGSRIAIRQRGDGHQTDTAIKQKAAIPSAKVNSTKENAATERMASSSPVNFYVPAKAAYLNRNEVRLWLDLSWRPWSCHAILAALKERPPHTG